MQTIGVSSPCGFFVSQDAKDSTRYICQITQSGTTLPDRDYYLKDDEKSTKARKDLKIYIRTIFELCNFKHPEKAAEQILDLETRLAKAQIPRVELRDAEKRYNPFTVSELETATPNLNWNGYLKNVIEADVNDLNVNTPAFFDGLNEIFTETEIPVWKTIYGFD